MNNKPPQTVPGTKLSNRRSVPGTDWMKLVIFWHWTSSAICLVGMVGFAVTGITLNHAGEIAVEPQVENFQLDLPADVLAELEELPGEATQALPHGVASYLESQMPVRLGLRQAEITESEVYLSMPSPGGDAWLSIDRGDGFVEFETTHRGWLAYLNDLHKGRNTGPVWRWFLDVFAVGTLVFCLTGLYLLYVHSRNRTMTWPLVGLGLVAPLLIALLLIH